MSKAPAVDYALRIIEFFANTNGDIGIADISNALDINKNAVSRVLEALMEQSWIYLTDSVHRKYRLALRPFSLINRHFASFDMIKMASPYVETLNSALSDATYLGVKDGRSVLYLIHCDSKRDIRINGCAGGRYPLHCTGPGKILLSYSDEKEVREYFDIAVKRQTERTITDYENFKVEAEKIKELGYAIDREEFAKGIICVSVPVFDCSQKVVGALGVSSLTLYDDEDSLIRDKLPLIKTTAEKISGNLGYK